MRQFLLLLLFGASFFSCSILKSITNSNAIEISDNQLSTLVNEASIELLNGSWLSEYLTSNSERPVLLIANAGNDAKVKVHLDSCYHYIERELVESGQVRYVRADAISRSSLPMDLVKKTSVDYVITANFKESTNNSEAIVIFVVSVWNDQSTLPIAEITKLVETNFSEDN